MSQMLKYLLSILLAFFLTQLEQKLQSNFLAPFMEANLITILVAVLAINSATLGIVLTKIRDLADRHGNAANFSHTRSQMLCSIKEQIALIACGLLLLIIRNSSFLQHQATATNGDFLITLNQIILGLLTFIFIYSIAILYDTAKSVFIILDFEFNQSNDR